MQSTVILLGGAYGSGKSTTGQLIAQCPENRYQTAVVDYDTLIGNSQGHAVDLTQIDEVRRKVWGETFIGEIIKKVHEGHELVVAPGTFATKARRQTYLHTIRQATEGMAQVVPHFYGTHESNY